MHLGTDEGRFSLVIGFRLRLRRHAKGTCDFLIPHLHQWGTSGRYPMPFLALNGAVLPASIKMIGEPYFCYYRLLPQVARTYLCTRNLSDSPFLEKGGLRTIHPTCMQLALPSRLSQQYKKLESKRVRPYIQCVCSWHPPEETQDRRQSDSAEAYMAFPKMLHSCLACLQ